MTSDRRLRPARGTALRPLRLLQRAAAGKAAATAVATAAATATLVVASACSAPDRAPELAGLSAGLRYDSVVQITGRPCEHVHDEGVREVVWSYDDGSSAVAGVYEGTLSGLTVSGGEAARRSKAIPGEQATADLLHETFATAFVTTDDSSDRECRWRWDDGRLSAVFARGGLSEAIWFPADGGDAVLLAEITDELESPLRGLSGRHTADRFLALERLARVDEPRVTEALLAYLQYENEKFLRGKAALLLADRGERRASALLLADLEGELVSVDVLRALGRIGDLRAERALRDALHRQGSYRIQSEIQSARAAIRKRLGMPPPDRR